MRFGILHLFLIATVLGFALAMRSWASSFGNDGFISMSGVGVSILTSAGFCFLGASMKKSIVLGTFSSVLVFSSHFAECLLKTSATEYVWSHPYFRTDLQLYAFMTFILTLGCYATSAGAAFVATWWSGRLNQE